MCKTSCNSFVDKISNLPVDTGRKLNVHKYVPVSKGLLISIV